MKITFQSFHTFQVFWILVMAESVFSLELHVVEGRTINFTGTEMHLLTVVWTS